MESLSTRSRVLVAIIVLLSMTLPCSQQAGSQRCREDSAEDDDIDLVIEKLRPGARDAANSLKGPSGKQSSKRRNRFPRHLHGGHHHHHASLLGYHFPHFMPHHAMPSSSGSSTISPVEFQEYKEYPALIPLMASLNVEALSEHLTMFDEKPHAGNTVLVDPYSLYKIAGVATADGPNAEFGSIFGRKAEPKYYLMPAFLFKLLLFTGLNQTPAGYHGGGSSAADSSMSYSLGNKAGFGMRF